MCNLLFSNPIIRLRRNVNGVFNRRRVCVLSIVGPAGKWCDYVSHHTVPHWT